jgi:L-lactate dehydrogenase
VIDEFRNGVERDVRYANIAIIEGNEASQFGIGIISARIAEAVLHDEQAVLPIGAYNAKYGVTLSLRRRRAARRDSHSRTVHVQRRAGSLAPQRRGSSQGRAAHIGTFRGDGVFGSMNFSRLLSLTYFSES